MLGAQVRGTENPRVGGLIPPLATTKSRILTGHVGKAFHTATPCRLEVRPSQPYFLIGALA